MSAPADRVRSAFGDAIRYAGLRMKPECEVAMAVFDAHLDALERVVVEARMYVDREVADDPTIADEHTALHELQTALALVENLTPSA